MAVYPILCALACCTLLADEPTKTLKEFSSKEGGFKVQMPGDPKEQKQKAAGVDFTAYVIETKEGAVMVAYSDLPIPGGETDEQIQARLDGAVQGMVTNIGAKLDKDRVKKIMLDKKHPGREVSADVAQLGGEMQARIYLVDKRLY